MDDELMREYIKEKKAERRQKSQAALGRVFTALGKAMPRGIRHPDSLITNMHLYRPTKGKHKTRLI